MELSDMLLWTTVGAGVGANLRSYASAMRLLRNLDLPREEEHRASVCGILEAAADGPVSYYLGGPGRLLAYKMYSWRG